MTNPKVSKTNKNTTAAESVQHQQNVNSGGLLNVLHESANAGDLNLDDFSFDPSSNSDDVEEEEDEVNSCSSFSLQECINEFRARRIRRLSTHSREVTQTEDPKAAGVLVAATADNCDKEALPDPAEADLINQNRSNKEQERKCKPCRNGFCYCFTSDSGDGVCNAVSTRAGHVRHMRRHKRSECYESVALMPQMNACPTGQEEKRRDGAPITFKMPSEQEQQALPQPQQNKLKQNATTKPSAVDANELTAISRLETSSHDAPLIHIIQELHNNCVISEVRVNKHKLPTSLSHDKNLNARKSSTSAPKDVNRDIHEPSAPPLECFTAINSETQMNRYTSTAPVMDKICELESLSDVFAYTTPPTNDSKHNDSGRRRHKAGGRLLQKRLSHSPIHSKPRRSVLPPPKPPRTYLSVEEKSTVSSLTSTSPSVHEAERIIDEFLLKRGIKITNAVKKAVNGVGMIDKAVQVNMGKVRYAIERKGDEHKSCPTTLTSLKSRRQRTLPSCPSLSDLERLAMDSNKTYSNYDKNIRQIADKPVKELSFGWEEPKIIDMLNCDTTTTHRRKFKSQAIQAEPQQAIIGWQVPPKVDLDTVDGGVCSNLASNIATKDTPVKAPPISMPRQARESHKFIWSEQWRNLSPWCNKKPHNGNRTLKSNLKSSSHSFLNSSKKKILRLVTPKRNNLSRRCNYSLYSVGVQTTPEESQPYEPSLTPLSPPGSYHSAVQTSTQSTTPTCSQNTNGTEAQNFDFSRTVRSPPKKAPRATTQRKLNFPHDDPEDSFVSGERVEPSACQQTKTYRSFQGDLDQDVTLSKLGYILGNIRAKLEASDEHAIRTFQEIERREQRAAGFDCTDGPTQQQQNRIVMHRTLEEHSPTRSTFHHEPIYSEIEEDSIHITGTPHYDNTTSAKEMPTAKPDVEMLYAKVNKANKATKSQRTQTQPVALGKLLHDSLRNMNTTAYATQLPPLLERSGSDTSYMSPPQPHAGASEISLLSHCQSLNNVRLQEQHSPPKRDRNLSKSDLSLHRSEIFLDNLCRSELIAECGEPTGAEKVHNNDLNQSCSSFRNDSINQINTYRHFSTSTPTPNDSISYDTPNDADFDNISQAAISQLGLSLASESLPTGAQITPKMQNTPKFITKVEICFDSYQSHNQLLDTLKY